MKTPDACTSLQDIRDAVDAIDRDILKLLGKRMPYVRAAVRFKKSEADIMQPDKMPAFNRQRREWAHGENIDEDFVERLYKVLVEHSFDVQLKLWKAQQR